jgi:hypothetical protein
MKKIRALPPERVHEVKDFKILKLGRVFLHTGGMHCPG